MANFPGAGGSDGAGTGFQLFTQSDNNSGIYADAAARDVYFDANQNEVNRVAADESLIIKLLDNGVGEVAYQQYTGDEGVPNESADWLDVTSLVQGEPGEDSVDVSEMEEGDTVRFNSSTQKLEPAPANVDDTTGEFTFDKSINVPAGSINVGEVLQLSEGTADLVVVDLLKEAMAFSVNAPFDDATGSSPPFYLDLGAPQTIVVQATDTTVITANPLTFQAPGTVVAPDVRSIDQVTIRANGAMTNVRIKIEDNATGLAVRYIPSKASYDSGEDGVSLIAGDNTFFLASNATDTPGNIHLGYSPFLVESGQLLDFTFNADSVDLLGNALDFPYISIEAHDGPPVELGQDAHATRVQTTGIIEGGLISQASATTIDWTSGVGQVANYADPEIPVITDVTWDAVAGYTPTNLATDGTTIFGYDSAGSLVERLTTAVTILDGHNIVWFGSVTHVSSTITNVIVAPANMGYDGISSFSDFANLVIGPANVDGNIYGPNGANLTIDVVGGNAFILGSNFRTDTKISDIVTLGSDTALTFVKMYRSAGAGLSMVYDGVPTTLIDPTQYDDGSGTLQTVAANRWTIQRIFRSRDGTTIVAYGQEEFTTKALALEALGNEPFTEKSPLPLTLFRGSLVVQESATDLSDTAEAEFFTQSSFRIAGAFSSSATIPGVTSPGGIEGSIQYNSGGAFGGNSRLMYTEPVAGETRLTIEASLSTGKAVTTYANEGGGTGLSIGHDDFLDNSFIESDIGPLTLSTDEANDDIVLLPATGGNVGIHKSEPSSPLHVYENNADQGSNNGLIIEQDGDGGAIAQFLLTGVKRWAMGLDNTNGTALGTRFLIASGSAFADAERAISIDNDEMVAVGNLPASESLTRTFTVYANNTGVSSSLIQQAGTGDAVLEWLVPGLRWSAGIDNSDDDKWMLSPSSGLADSILTVQTDGNVGINILSPASPLHVFTSDPDTTAPLTINTGGTNGGISALYVGDRTPEGNVTAIGGSLYIREGGTSSALYLKQSATATNSGWVDLNDSGGDLSGPGPTTIANSIAVFGDTTGLNIAERPTARVSTTGTSTHLTMDAETATGSTNIILNDENQVLRAALGYNNDVDQLQLNSAIGDIVLFTGVGLTQTNSSSSTQNYNRMVSPNAAALTGFQIENTSSDIDFEMYYNEATDRSYIIDRSASGMEIETVNGILFLKSATDDIILDLSSNAGRVEISGLNHTDGHPILNIATSDGDADFYVGTDTPVSNISAVGGSYYFRDDELDTALYFKRSAGAASTTGWVPVITGPASTVVDNALVTFDGTTGEAVQQSSGVTSTTTATEAEIALTAQGATGGAAIEFYDNLSSLKFSFIHNDNLDENSIISDVGLSIEVIGSALDIDSGDDITINANANANLVTINDDFVFGATTVDAIFEIKAPSATATAGVRLSNNTSTPEVQFEYNQNTDVASIELYNEVPLSITGIAHDDNDILLTLATQGTNAGQSDFYVGDRDPNGNVAANGGDLYIRDGGTSSEMYIKKEDATSANWNRVINANPDEGIEFVPTTVSSNIEGQVYYDSTDKSLSVSQGSGVTANLGKETFVPPRVRNDQGAEINNADAVYISGSDGTYPDVKLAQANTQATSGVIGLITQDAVAIGALGWCTTYGLVRDFDTQTPGWSAGDVLYLSATTAGELTNVAPTFPNFVTRVGTVVAVGTTDGSIFVNHPSKEEATGSTPVTKSYAVGDYGTDDVNYSAGFYEYSIDEAVLTIGGTVDQVFGDANRALNAHAFVVIGSTTTTGCTLTVHGTSIDNSGTRTTLDSEIIIADTDGVAVNEYYETSKKWLGDITFTLTGTSGVLDFNFGVAKYEDFGNTNFTVTEFEAVGKAAGNDADTDIILWHHSSVGWTYNAGAFKPEPTKICSMGDDYSTDDNIDSGKYFSYKRTGLGENIDGTALEGVIIEFDIPTNNALWYANFHIGVLL